MAALPRGITSVDYKTAEGKVLKYRVRVRRKDYQRDKLFDSLEEAKEFLLNSKTNAGREAIAKKSFEQEYMEEFMRSPPLGHYIKAYVDENFTYYPNYDGILRKKLCQSARSFFKTIGNTILPLGGTAQTTDNIVVEMIALARKPFGKFKLEEIDYFVINNYIEHRKRQGKALTTVRKEISLLAGLFEDLMHKSRIAATKLSGKNPAKEFNRKLLRPPKKELEIHPLGKKAKRISEADYDNILLGMYEVKDVEVFEIFLLGLFTSMRRSEMLFLEWEQIKENYVDLIHTKSGKPRKVFLTKDAKDLLAIIGEGKNKTGKVFSITFYSFEKNWQRLQKKFGFVGVNFHCVRKESISNLVERLGTNSSLMVAELLGISNITTLEKEYFKREADISTEEGILEHAGHARKQTTKDHYFSLDDKNQN